MSASFYKILLVSLAITVGLFLMFYGYRYLIRSVRREAFTRKFAKLYTLEGEVATGIVTFHYEIPEDGKIKFEICNDNFEVILPVSEEEKQEGDHTLDFDTRKLPDGNYYYQLTVSGQTIFKRMIIKNH